MGTRKQEEFLLVLQQYVILNHFDIEVFIYGRLVKQDDSKIYHFCQSECNLNLYHALQNLKVPYSLFQLEYSCINLFIPMYAKKICKHQLFLYKYAKYSNTILPWNTNNILEDKYFSSRFLYQIKTIKGQYATYSASNYRFK